MFLNISVKHEQKLETTRNELLTLKKNLVYYCATEIYLQMEQGQGLFPRVTFLMLAQSVLPLTTQVLEYAKRNIYFA